MYVTGNCCTSSPNHPPYLFDWRCAQKRHVPGEISGTVVDLNGKCYCQPYAMLLHPPNPNQVCERSALPDQTWSGGELRACPQDTLADPSVAKQSCILALFSTTVGMCDDVDRSQKNGLPQAEPSSSHKTSPKHQIPLVSKVTPDHYDWLRVPFRGTHSFTPMMSPSLS